MVNILSVEDLVKIVNKRGFKNFLIDLIAYLKDDFKRWDDFDKTARTAHHSAKGVIELMPICDQKYYSFKYVNGHPNNPLSGRQTVVATGQLSDAETGYPLLISEMTTLTAFRTAAIAALASDLLARDDSKTIAMIGTGAQSEFQIMAHLLVRDVQTVRYFDIDPDAMKKFANNMNQQKPMDKINLIPCANAKEAVKDADIIITATACKQHVDVIRSEWVKPGVHINGLGGDCPGKTELQKEIIPRSKLVVEYFKQSFIEGEIQHFSELDAHKMVYAEIYEIINGSKPGRISSDEITVFDSVGFAIEDFSALRLTYDLAKKYHIGKVMNMVPPIADPKNLFSILNIDTSKNSYTSSFNTDDLTENKKV